MWGFYFLWEKKMTIKELIEDGVKKIKECDIENAIFIAKTLLSKVLGVNSQYILINQNIEINSEVVRQFYCYVELIIEGKPLQYITNHQEFMGYDFFVNEYVLIPQPDTEIVVRKCIEICNKLLLNNKCKIKILDLCTGSGAIAISIDKILNKDDNVEVYASDISAEALEIAEKNKKILSSSVKFIQSDMFKNIDEKFDIIISNPPYIKTDVIKTLTKDVQSEPNIALDGGPDGLTFYKIIEKESVKYLNNNGYLVMEIGFDQADEVKEILKTTYENIEIYKDLADNDRCIIAKMK